MKRMMRRAAIDRPRQLRQEARGDKPPQPFRADLLRAGEEKRQHRKEEQAPKPDWIARNS